MIGARTNILSSPVDKDGWTSQATQAIDGEERVEASLGK